jgi:ADP-ribose pyrophosphatase
MPEVSEIRIQSRRLACENARFDVFFDHVMDTKNGHEVPNFLTVSPKVQRNDLVSGVAILPICGNEVGLVRMYRPPIREWSWEIPHGFLEVDELEQCAALREFAEEAGVSVQSVESLGLMTPDAGILAGRVHLFAVQCEQSSSQITPEFGLREFRWFTRQDFLKMLKNSTVQDSFTLSAWCRYLLKQTI